MKTATLLFHTHFNAAYRTYNPYWDKTTNEKVFGALNGDSPRFIGHNYELTIELTGAINPLTGEVFNKAELAKLVKTEIENRYDHRNLYDDVSDFKDTVPTTEKMATKIWELLQANLPHDLKLKVTIAESKDFAASYNGE